MPKALCIVGMVVAALLLLIFALDLAMEFPFGRTSLVIDIAFMACALGLGWLGWTTLKEQT